MDRIGDLRLFLRVLDSGSITAAAHSLNLSVAVVSLRLKRLEREIGLRLLHRTTRRLSPTVEGTALAQRGRALADEFEALTQGLRSSGTGVAGTLRITTAPCSDNSTSHLWCRNFSRGIRRSVSV